MLIEYFKNIIWNEGVNESMASLVFHSLPSLSIHVAHKELWIEALLFLVNSFTLLLGFRGLYFLACSQGSNWNFEILSHHKLKQSMKRE
jgi:hypothetical protein